MKKIVFGGFAALFVVTCAEARTFRIRPGESVAKVFEAARAAGGAREIVFADGVHEMTGVIELDERDNGLVVRAEHEGKAVLTGARKVTGWKPDAKDPGLLVAPFPFEPGEWTLYTLVVNGRSADFSVYPRFGSIRRMRYFAEESDAAKGNRTVLHYDAHDIPAGLDFSDLDITSAFLFVPQEWFATRCRIATNDWQHDIFHLRDRTAAPIGQFNQGYHVMNTRLGLADPGSWMFESAARRILYRPRTGETAGTLVATLSHAAEMFRLDRVKDVRFEGLVLEGCVVPFKGWNEQRPHVLIGGDVSTNVTVEACELRDSSGGGIEFHATKNFAIRRCHIHHLGAHGVRMTWGGDVCEISDSHFHDNGRLSISSPSVEAHIPHMTVVRNHIHHMPGCGAVLWTSYSVFASNHLHHTMMTTRDGGGLYGAQNFSVIRDNYLHDLGDWSGLYNDEGGRDTVYTGNRFEGAWWPIHMHDTYGIVVTNNTFTCDGSAMRFSFQGATHSIFSNNVINTTVPIETDRYLENCDVWADNDVRLKQPDGTYKSVGKLTLPKLPCPPKAPAAVMERPHSGWIRLDRDAKGLSTPGVPGAMVWLSRDKEFLHVNGTYEYNKFIHYDGSVRLGETWGKHDAVRFFFGDFDVTAFIGRRVVASDPAVGITTNNSYSVKTGGCGDGGSRFGFKVPLSLLKDLSFNAVSYNGDHDEYKYFTQPVGGRAACGKLEFATPPVDYTGRADPRRRLADGTCDLPGPTCPGGVAQCGPVTADRPDAGYDAQASGYDVRHAELLGYVQCGDAPLQGFLLQPFTGADPAGPGRMVRRMDKASESAREGFYGLFVENWALRTELTASKSAAYHKVTYERGGVVKLLLDTQAVAPSWRRRLNAPAKVTASESQLKDGVFTGHVRATVDGKAEDLFAAIAFDPKPLAVRELADNGRLGKRYVLDFFVKPVTGALVARAAVSGKSAKEALDRLNAEPAGFDFEAVKKATKALWQEKLKPAAK